MSMKAFTWAFFVNFVFFSVYSGFLWVHQFQPTQNASELELVPCPCAAPECIKCRLSVIY